MTAQKSRDHSLSSLHEFKGGARVVGDECDKTHNLIAPCVAGISRIKNLKCYLDFYLVFCEP